MSEVFTVFFSWQSDTTRRHSHDLIRESLELAGDAISSDASVPFKILIQSDTENEPGLCNIPETILRRLRESDVIVSDLTFIARTEPGDGQPVKPICYVKAADLNKAWISTRDSENKNPKSEKLAEILGESRECEQFTQWLYDFSAKEHYEMMLHERQAERDREWRREQREWQREREEAANKFQVEQAERDRRWREEDIARAEAQLEIAKTSMRVGIRTTLLSAVIGFFAALAAVALARLLEG